jgi:protein tyrosine/serine phosphatase
MRFSCRFHTSVLLALAMWVPPVQRTPAHSAPLEQASQSSAQAAAARVQYTGLPNFGVVSNQLHRGGQPRDTGFAELKKLGVDIVVNLRHEPDQIAREGALVKAQGMRYVSIPWRGKEEPKTEQVAEFLALLRENANKKVFVHCQRGAERTGVFVGCYRMSSERWTSEQALAEMEAFQFRGLRFGHLKRFIRAFPTLLIRDPLLSALTQPAGLP